MLNTVSIMGRLARDPELRRTGSGLAVASFTVAVERDFAGKGQEKETDFIDCTAWRQTGEFVSKYFTKGSMIVVRGRLQVQTYEKDGQKRKKMEVVAENCYFGESKRSSAGSDQYAPPAGQEYNSYGGGYVPDQQSSAYSVLTGDDEQLPF